MNKNKPYDYRVYTYKSELDKAIHTLEGMLKGIAIDNEINQEEIGELRSWYLKHEGLIDKHPFSEIIPALTSALDNNSLEQEGLKNILWLCNNLKTGSVYYNTITSDIQILQGILHGIMADNIITKDEVVGLQKWLDENSHLIGVYPYDEINSPRYCSFGR